MSKWDAQTDAALFLTIMEVSDIKVSDWQKIATRMNEKGHSLSKEGCRQHFQKLKKRVAANKGTTPATPKSGTVSTGKRKRTKDMEANGADDEEMFATPSKTAKREKNRITYDLTKKEEGKEDYGGLNGQSGMLFKVERDEDEAVDLENEDIYYGNDTA